jgi:hypothetical protein
MVHLRGDNEIYKVTTVPVGINPVSTRSEPWWAGCTLQALASHKKKLQALAIRGEARSLLASPNNRRSSELCGLLLELE